MEKSKKIEIKNVKDSIVDYKKYRNDDYLVRLIMSLKVHDVYIVVETEVESSISEKDSEPKIKNNYSIFPMLSMTTDNKFWFASFSDLEEIPEIYKESNKVIIPVKFKDLVDECLKHRDIEGISINHASNEKAHIAKFILRAIKHHL